MSSPVSERSIAVVNSSSNRSGSSASESRAVSRRDSGRQYRRWATDPSVARSMLAFGRRFAPLSAVGVSSS